MHLVAGEVPDRPAERRDLGEREVHEDDAALDDVDAEIGVDPGQDEARDERGEQDFEDGHLFFSRALFSRAAAIFSTSTSKSDR